MNRDGLNDRADIELAQAGAAGDRAATEVLLRRHYDRVATLCRRLMTNQADAEDATQNALLAVVSGLPRFDGRSAFTTWLHRVTTNACLDELRRRSRKPVPASDLVESDASPPLTREPDVVGRIDIDDALRRLPLEFRAPVVLRDLCGLDYAEIADLLEIPAGTVRSRIARGRGMLRTIIGNPSPSAVVQGDENP